MEALEAFLKSVAIFGGLGLIGFILGYAMHRYMGDDGAKGGWGGPA